jgi:hypothetical protein
MKDLQDIVHELKQKGIALKATGQQRSSASPVCPFTGSKASASPIG